MVRRILMPILLLVVSYQVFAQGEDFVRAGLLRAQATFAPSIMLGQNQSNIFLHADVEYFLEDRISLRNDTYIYLMTINRDNSFKHYYSNFTGAAYHVPVKNIDIHFSLQPGVGFIQTRESFFSDQELKNPRLKAIPMMAVGIGANFLIHKNFHFLAHVKYIKGTYTGGLEPLKINEFMFSAGLGWNINKK